MQTMESDCFTRWWAANFCLRLLIAQQEAETPLLNGKIL